MLKRRRRRERQPGVDSPENPLLQKLELDDECLGVMRQTLGEARSMGLLDATGRDKAHSDNGAVPEEVSCMRRWRQSPMAAEMRCAELQDRRRIAEPPGDKAELPMNRAADDVLNTIADHQYSIIVGETGSGKTTQVPQIILDDAIENGTGAAVNIICTQPRRIAATSVAARVAGEWGEELGETIGYHIRHDAELPTYGGSVTYCTTGILLKQLTSSPDEVFDGISHIILDEIHERDINVDFTLIMLKRQIMARARAGKPIPKLVLMSATIDTNVFKSYFNDLRMEPYDEDCAVLHVPGRTFPVQRQYLEDFQSDLMGVVQKSNLSKMEASLADKWISWDDRKDRERKHRQAHKYEKYIKKHQEDEREKLFVKAHPPPASLIAAMIVHILQTTQSGAILVFVPGIGEITKIRRALEDNSFPGFDFKDSSRYSIFQLHSLLEQDQRTVFRPSPQGVRKIILATNIAETSITIPDVTVVLDTGAIRRMQYDADRRRSELLTCFVSKSNLSQRAGRAGRVQPGSYYAFFARNRLDDLPELPVPEMRLADLAGLGLTIKAQRNPAPIAGFLADAVEPPSERAVTAAIDDLKGIGAITENENITPLGQALAQLPMHPVLGKLVILGIIFKCLDPILLLGIASEEMIWDMPLNAPDRAREANRLRLDLAEGTYSLHFAMLHAYRDLRHAVKAMPGMSVDWWCRKNYLRPRSIRNIEMSARQTEELLSEAGLLPGLGKVDPARATGFNRPFGPQHLNVNSDNEDVIRIVLAAALQPNMAWLGSRKSYRSCHNKSIVPGKPWADMLPISASVAQMHLGVVLFDRAVWTDLSKTTFMDNVTPVAPLVAALFGSSLRVPSEDDSRYTYKKRLTAANMVVGDWSGREKRSAPMFIKLEVGEKTSVGEAFETLFQFRSAMSALLDRVLRDLVQGRSADKDSASEVAVNALVRVASVTKWSGPQTVDRLCVEKYQKRTRRGESDDFKDEDEDEDDEDDEDY